MPYDPDDTICAIGTASGGAVRGMVRLSGADAIAVAARVFEADDCGLFEAAGANRRQGKAERWIARSRRACTVRFVFVARHAQLFARTCHGVPYDWLDSCFGGDRCRRLQGGGAWPAEPGEFTMRAFLAGRIDLTQAEAVLGVVDATGAGELSAALAQLAGGIAEPLQRLREDLLQLLAELEAGLDFVEEDIRFISQNDVLHRLQSASELLTAVSQQMESRHAASELPQVALVGPPNAGKSSLFNAILEAQRVLDASASRGTVAAIVSPQRGTTRDYLTAAVSFGDLRCELLDTAGVEDGDERLADIEGQARGHALELRKRATVRAYCVAAPELTGDAASVSGVAAAAANCDVVVVTKADLVSSNPQFPNEFDEQAVIVTSSRMKFGIVEFGDTVRRLLNRDGKARMVTPATAERCRDSVRLAADALDAAAALVSAGAGDELVASELRAVLAELGKVVGVVYTDDLLDRIFKTFCIGK